MGENVAVQDAVVIRRQFDAPRELVWKMWTDPSYFAEWYGPDGFSVPVAEWDLRVGGRRLVCMERLTPNGPLRMWFAGTYLEIIENERLVYTDYQSDESGREPNGSTVGGSEDTSHATEVQVELQDSPTGTILVLTHKGIPSDSPGAAGWNMALDKLQAVVETIPH